MMHTVLLFMSGGLIIAAGVIPNTSPISADVIQGSALLSMTWTIWYILARTFPSFMKAMKDQREDFLGYLHERDNKQ